jgi:hypothetical protein
VTDGVWLVTGVQPTRKSTIADLLARQFERGVHVRGGQFYRWAVRRRERQRNDATGKLAYRPGWFSPEDLDSFLAVTPRIGLWLDTSAVTAEQTVRQILSRRAEAVVDGTLAVTG